MKVAYNYTFLESLTGRQMEVTSCSWRFDGLWHSQKAGGEGGTSASVRDCSSKARMWKEKDTQYLFPFVCVTLPPPTHTPTCAHKPPWKYIDEKSVPFMTKLSVRRIS